MTRQIKFRAFVNGELYIQEYCGGFCYFIRGESDALSLEDVFVLAEKGKCLLQQWTGLTDISGREIYEGDIVEFYAGYPNQNDCSFYKSKAEVEFENGAFWPRLLLDYNDDDTWYNYEIKDLKVLGNIFENPELLR